MEKERVAGTQDKIAKYIGVKCRRDPGALYTDKFAGKVTLTAAEWKTVRDSVKDYAL